MWVNCVEDEASPWSYFACARIGTLPFKVVSEDSLTAAVIRGAMLELWAVKTEPQNNIPASMQMGSERKLDIVVFLDPFIGDNHPKSGKVVVASGKAPKKPARHRCVTVLQVNAIIPPACVH
jgi:hypothetical protein